MALQPSACSTMLQKVCTCSFESCRRVGLRNSCRHFCNISSCWLLSRQICCCVFVCSCTQGKPFCLVLNKVDLLNQDQLQHSIQYLHALGLPHCQLHMLHQAHTTSPSCQQAVTSSTVPEQQQDEKHGVLQQQMSVLQTSALTGCGIHQLLRWATFEAASG